MTTDSTNSQRDKALRFKTLHERAGTFVIPNPWDAGTARILTALGFEALTTTSAGLAFTLGKRDGAGLVSLDETLANARAIVDATPLPVAADLENGFGDRPEDAAATIRRAALEAGLVGGSIEDATGDDSQPIYEFAHAVDRVRAAAEAARSLPFPFMLVGRAENYLHGRKDLADTIRRLQAFEEAGADVLYAPGLTKLDDIRSVCESVGKPVNVLAGIPDETGRRATIAELSSTGAKRISLGSALNRVALGAMLSAAKEIQRNGELSFLEKSISFAEVMELMSDG